MRWQGRRESDNVEDRRNQSGPIGGGNIRLPRGKGGIVPVLRLPIPSMVLQATARRMPVFTK